MGEWIRKVKKGAWRMPWLSGGVEGGISFGEVQMTFDPEISEWDNPIS